MDLFSLLPFLSGWDDVPFSKSNITLKKGEADTLIYSEESDGWILGLDIITDDLYSEVKFTYNGITFGITPYLAFSEGAILPAPGFSIFMDVSIQPSQLSSAGLYIVSVCCTYPLPIKGTVKIQANLGNSSTQISSNMSISFHAIKLTDKELFLKSVKVINEKIGGS